MRSVRNGAEPCLEPSVVNFVGMKLEIDPPVHAHRGDALNVAGLRTEGQPVQGMDGALVIIHPRRRPGGLVFLPADRELRRQPSRHKQSSGHQPAASGQRHFHSDWPH